MQDQFRLPVIENRPRELRKAYRLTWLAVWLTLLTYIIGASWDGEWHRTRVFDTFYSPPHLFIYIMVFLTAMLLVYITFSKHLRSWFGPGFLVPPLTFKVPGTLVITGGGFVILAIAGMLDDFWHSSFGLDETLWSTPHALLSWGLSIVAFGFIACLLNFRRFYRLRWYSKLFLSWLIAVATIGPVLNPFVANRTPEMVWAKAHLHIYAIQPLAQHTFRIYLHWNLTLTNLIALPLVIFWIGLVLNLARCVEKRGWILLIVAFLAAPSASAEAHTLITVAPLVEKHVANWLALPLFPAALILLLLLKTGLAQFWQWSITGLVVAICMCLIWQPVPQAWLIGLICAPLAFVGARIGRTVYGILEQPTALTSWALLFIAVSGAFLVGSIDLYLRQITP